MQQLVDRVLGEHLAVTRAAELSGRCVAHDLATDAVDDHDRIGGLVERGEQPVLHGLRSGHPIGRLPIGLGDRIDEAHVVAHVHRLARVGATRVRACTTSNTATAAASHPTTAIAATTPVTHDPAHQEHARASPLTRTDL